MAFTIAVCPYETWLQNHVCLNLCFTLSNSVIGKVLYFGGEIVRSAYFHGCTRDYWLVVGYAGVVQLRFHIANSIREQVERGRPHNNHTWTVGRESENLLINTINRSGYQVIVHGHFLSGVFIKHHLYWHNEIYRNIFHWTVVLPELTRKTLAKQQA